MADAAESGADALGVAAGDGSLAVVAAAALAHGIPFVCVPAGTRNHFALDVGVDRRDMVGALDAFTDGVERRIDVARVNGRLLLNNVSFGVYGDAVRRPEYRDARVRTLLATAQAVLGPGGAAPELRLVDDRGCEHRHPPVVVISNNPYALHRPVATGTRPSLTSGRLGILVLDRPDDAMRGRGRRERGRAWTATSLEVDAPEPVHLGVDGEPIELNPPHEYVILPATLRVRISSRHSRRVSLGTGDSVNRPPPRAEPARATRTAGSRCGSPAASLTRAWCVRPSLITSQRVSVDPFSSPDRQR